MGSILALLLALFRNLKDLVPLPDLASAADFRKWCLSLVGLCQDMAARTAMKLDDEIAAAFRLLHSPLGSRDVVHATLNEPGLVAITEGLVDAIRQTQARRSG